MIKRALVGLLALTATLLAVTGCDLSAFTNPIGVPTVSVALGDVSLEQDANTGNWTLSFAVNVYTLPGSPAGVASSFRLQNGGTLSAGLRLDACPSDAPSSCGPFIKNYSLEFSSVPPTNAYVITAVTVTGENNAVYTQQLADPVVIH